MDSNEGAKDQNSTTLGNASTQDDAVDMFNFVRKDIKAVAAHLKGIRTEHPKVIVRDGEDRGEVMANLTLAYRHLEDASMRLGKAIQARDGGISVYDRDTTVGA